MPAAPLSGTAHWRAAMTARRLRAWWSVLALLCVALALAGCATIKLVPAYDEQIDSGLTSLYADTSMFVDKMIAASATPAGTYEQNIAFYDGVDGRLEALIVRAEAHRVLKDCPASKVVNRAFELTNLPADVRGKLGNLPSDDCQVVLLRLTKGAFGDMRTVHKAQGANGIPAWMRGQFMDGGPGALLRAGITVEIAKRAK